MKKCFFFVAPIQINRKIKIKFLGLCHNNLNQIPGEKFPTTAGDLQGFWDMLLLQVDHVDSIFAEIEDLKKNNWQVGWQENCLFPCRTVVQSCDFCIVKLESIFFFEIVKHLLVPLVVEYFEAKSFAQLKIISGDIIRRSKKIVFVFDLASRLHLICQHKYIVIVLCVDS